VRGPGIVIGRKGNAGKVNWVSADFFPIDTTFYVLPRSKSISLHFLFHALRELDLPNYSGDSAVPGLNRDTAYSLILCEPSHEVLRCFDQVSLPWRLLMDNNESESRTLTSLRDALLNPLLSGELRVTTAGKVVAEVL